MSRQEIIDKIKDERKSEILKSEQRLKDIRNEIDKWPEWKKKCDFYTIVRGN